MSRADTGEDKIKSLQQYVTNPVPLHILQFTPPSHASFLFQWYRTNRRHPATKSTFTPEPPPVQMFFLYMVGRTFNKCKFVLWISAPGLKWNHPCPGTNCAMFQLRSWMSSSNAIHRYRNRLDSCSNRSAGIKSGQNAANEWCRVPKRRPSPPLLNKIDTTEQRASFVQFHFIPYYTRNSMEKFCCTTGNGSGRDKAYSEVFLDFPIMTLFLVNFISRMWFCAKLYYTYIHCISKVLRSKEYKMRK